MLFAVVATVAGCRGCFCTNFFKSMTDSPPEKDVREQVEKKLPTAREIASELCGIPTDGLKNAVVKVVKQTLGTSDVHVEGTAIGATGAEDAGKGAELDVKKALVCAGVLSVIFLPDLDADGKATGWKMGTMEVTAIETAGVHFDESQHQHHHHHHH